MSQLPRSLIPPIAHLPPQRSVRHSGIDKAAPVPQSPAPPCPTERDDSVSPPATCSLVPSSPPASLDRVDDEHEIIEVVSSPSWHALGVKELRELCRKHGLAPGKKAEMIASLDDALGRS